MSWNKEKWLKSRPVKFLSLIVTDALEKDIFKDAYAMAYVTLLSLIPSLAASFALVSLFVPIFGENSTLLKQVEGLILKHLATGSGQAAVEQLQGFLANTDFKKIGVSGLIGTLVTLTLLLKQIEETFNRIFEVHQQRSILQRFLYFWTVLTLGTFCLGISLGTLSNFAWGSRYLELTLSQQLIRDAGYLGGLFILFLFIYKFAPNRHIPLKAAFVGALIATTLFVQALRFFSLYVTSFTRYEAIYGALSALPIFLLWLYVIWFIILVAALFAKRTIDGVPEGAFTRPFTEKTIKREHFEVVLPFLVLLKTYDAFEDAQRCTADKISHEIYVSETIVQKAFARLETAGLVVCQHNEDKKNGDLEYYPRVPKNKLSFAEARRAILGSAEPWIRNLHFRENPALHSELYREAVQAYMVAAEEPLSAIDLKEQKLIDDRSEVPANG